MNDNTGGSQERSRRWPRRAGILAAAAGTTLLIAACGGSASTNAGPATTGTAARSQQALAFAQCMRSHGVPDFPDPGPDGRFGQPSNDVLHNPHLRTADSACSHLLPNGGASGGNKTQQQLPQLLHIAQCMRSHGVPNYPDPNPNTPADLQQLGINENSPQFQSAQRTCQRLYPPLHPSQGSGS